MKHIGPIAALMWMMVWMICVNYTCGRKLRHLKDYKPVPLELEEFQLDLAGAAQYQPIGCFKDLPDRALGDLYSVIDAEEVIKGCARDAVAKGYVYFGVQYYRECWGDSSGHDRYDMYGISTNCISGRGKDWANYVYRIVRAEGFCIANFQYHKYGDVVHKNDPCKSCVCQSDGIVICKDEKCPQIPLCQKKVTPSGECCQICECYHNGITYNEGDRWQMTEGSLCHECQCSNNSAICLLTICPTCDAYVSVLGQCCRACATEAPKTVIIIETTERPVLTLPLPPPPGGVYKKKRGN